MQEYDGSDLRPEYGSDDAPGMPDDRLPPGWGRFDPDDGEAGGDEAYLFANGHQVLIGGADDGGYIVLAYPEHGLPDAMGFVRPLAGGGGEAITTEAGSLTRARDFAHGYMAAVVFYESDSLNFDPFDR